MVTEFRALSAGIREISISTGRKGFRKPEGFSSGHKGENRYENLKTLAEACRKTDWPLIKWIAARVLRGTAKGAKTVLHQLARGHPQRKPASATEPCAQLEFQSTVSSEFPFEVGLASSAWVKE
jgi:hypothetical protein